jgi:hypothetical protein
MSEKEMLIGGLDMLDEIIDLAIDAQLDYGRRLNEILSSESRLIELCNTPCWRYSA